MRIFLVILGFVLHLSSLAQGEFALGFQASPNFTYRILRNNSGTDQTQDYIDYLNKREMASLGYRLALVGNVRLSERWILEAGFSFIRNRYVLNVEDLMFGDQVDPRRGFVYEGASFDQYKLESEYLYAGMPVRLIWNFGTENIKVLIHLGLTPQVLLRDRFTQSLYLDDEVVDKNEIDNYEEIRSFNLSPFFGVGAQFRLNENFFLRAEGIARYGALNVSDNSPISTYLYSSELNIGVYYRFISSPD
jgi:hypothetical protein